MSMLISQADELRTLAGGLRKLCENGANLTRVQVAGMITAVEAMREAADTIEGMRDRLQELQGVGDESRYTALFGTPERAARTAYDMHECSLGMPIECDDCAAKPICESGAKDYDALLEWLRGDA